MSSFFDITREEIAQLDDASLRELIGHLCEADFSLAGMPTHGITWGGNQDAPDGGFDVVVRSDTLPPGSSIGRVPAGLQVKKPEMSASKITGEMRPDGVLRESIMELIANKGAYIIISGKASTSEKALQSRLKPIQIYPGSPWENGYNERFNGTLRREILNAEWFSNVKQAQVVINRWLKQYNHIRPHQALNMRPPVPETLLQSGT